MYLVILNNIEKSYSIVENLSDIPEMYVLTHTKLRKRKRLYSHEELMAIREELLNGDN
jgi:hypothetical protein